MITRTHTRTHVEVTFANPYLTCDTCRPRVGEFVLGRTRPWALRDGSDQ